MKKLLLLLMVIFSTILTSCTIPEVPLGENQVRLPNLSGMSRVEIEEELKDLEIEYIFYIENEIATIKYDTFVRYGNGNKAGSIVEKGDFIRIYTTPLNLTFKLSNTFTMDFEYKGKSFINDGVGEVTLVRPTDGDTARFRDIITGETFALRFLGIDTPESTMQKEPWGKAASKFCADKLQNAKTIVLEAEGPRTENYGRYLGWVWIDGVLFNLEVVEEAYSNSKVGRDSKYHEYFSQVDTFVSKTGRRFFGEIDPDYDYNTGNFK